MLWRSWLPALEEPFRFAFSSERQSLRNWDTRRSLAVIALRDISGFIGTLG